MDPLEKVEFVQKDFKEITELTVHKVNVLLSDMAPNMTGFKSIDQNKMNDILNELLLKLDLLSAGGNFCCKYFNGVDNEILDNISKHFEKTKKYKPKSSRSSSSEEYIVCFNKR